MLFLSQRPLSRGDLDRELFAGREAELERLRRAARLDYNVLLLGEPGAGVTSLLNQHARGLEEAGQRACVVSALGAQSVFQLATTIRIAAAGPRPARTVVRPRHPMADLRERLREASFPWGTETRKIPGDPDPVGPLRDLIDELGEADPFYEAESVRFSVLLDGISDPALIHRLFGRCRDEVWGLPLRWVVAGRLDARDRYLESPADVFFDTEVVAEPLHADEARNLVVARLERAAPGDEADVRRIRSRLDQIVERGAGVPRRLLAAAREALLSTAEEAKTIDEALAVAASLGKTESAVMHYLVASGATSASDADFLAELGVSRSRATQVLKRLEASSLVLISEMRTGRGRPRRLYRPVGTRPEEES